MRWFCLTGGIAVLLGCLGGTAGADSWLSPYRPFSPGLTVTSGCCPPPAPAPTPSTAPAATPSTAPATTPSTTPQTTPGTTPEAQSRSTPSDTSTSGETAGAAAGEAGAGELGSAAPTMFGDLLAGQTFGPLYAILPNGQTLLLSRGQPVPSTATQPGTRYNFDFTILNPNGSITTLPTGQPLPANVRSGAPLPFAPGGAGLIGLVASGAFKITENESPRPQDRVFAFYNYFNDVNASLNPGPARTDVHREVAGFEKTFLDGDASIGLRAPLVQIYGDSSVAYQDFGDLSVILKYALINDRTSGNVLSAGLVVTAPTGSNFLPAGLPDIHPFLFQPFVGGIVNFDRLYVLGFSSIVIPTDMRDVTFLSNDVGIGYSLYSNPGGLVSSIAPTVEGHLTTPLNHRGADSVPIGLPDIFNMTFATRFGIGERASLGLGVALPLTSPRPFNFEIQAAFNFRF